MTTPLHETHTWRVLAREWVTVLGGEAPRSDSTFFTAGGDSLAATELTERIEASLHVQLSIADVLASPTFGDLVQRTSRLGVNTQHSPREALPRPSVRQFKMLRTIESYPALGDSRRISYVFEIMAEADLTRLRRALVSTVNSEASLLSRFQLAGSDWHVTVDAPRDDDAIVTVTNADATSPDEIGALVRDLRTMPMAPHLPQVRFVILPQQRLLVAMFGHLVFDGMSLPIFLRRLARRYQTPEQPPQLRMEYFELVQDWYTNFEAGSLNEDEKYWRRHVAVSGMWAPVALPTLVTVRPMSAVKAVDYSVDVDRQSTEQFVQWSNKIRVPLYFGLMSAATAAIRHESAQEHGFGVEIETSGRTAPGSSSVIGLFTDYVSVRLGDLDERLDSLATQVHERTLSAIQHGHYPRHLLTGMRDELMPHRANWLFRMGFDEGRQVSKASSGLLQKVSTYDGRETSRVLPGFRLTADRLAQTGQLRLTMQVGESDLDPTAAESLMASWRQTISEAGSTR